MMAMRKPSVTKFDHPTNPFGRRREGYFEERAEKKTRKIFYFELTHFSLLNQSLQYIQRATRHHSTA